MVIKESELESYFDERGELTNLAIDQFLSTKKVVRLQKEGKGWQRILIQDKDGKMEYFDLVNQIHNILAKRNFRKKGSMGVTEIKNENKENTGVQEDAHISSNW